MVYFLVDESLIWIILMGVGCSVDKITEAIDDRLNSLAADINEMIDSGQKTIKT